MSWQPMPQSNENPQRVLVSDEGRESVNYYSPVPLDRDVVIYSVSDHELDSLSKFTALPSVFFSLTLLFLTVGIGGFITLFQADWLFSAAMVAVGVIFAFLGIWAFREKNSYIDKIRGESTHRPPQ